MSGMEENKHLSFASSLCGACTSVCPVKINIHNLLLLNRKQSVDEGLTEKNERYIFKFWEYGMKNPKMLDRVPASFKNFALRQIQKDTWSKRREPLQVAPKSFRQLWKEKNPGA